MDLTPSIMNYTTTFMESTATQELLGNNSSSSAPTLVSHWTTANVWVWRFAATVLMILGLWGNTMAILTFRLCTGSTSSIPMYLSLLAVTDTLTLLSGVGVKWFHVAWNLNLRATPSHTACKLLTWVMNVSAACSSWFLVAVTVQRAVSVVIPHRVASLCTRGRSKAIAISIVMTLALLYSHILVGVVRGPEDCTISNLDYLQFWLNIWVNVDLVIFSLLPFGVLVISNCILVWHLVRSVASARSNLSSDLSTAQVSIRKKQASSTTITIVVMSATFVVLTCPVLIFNVVSNIHESSPLIEDPHKRWFFYNLFFLISSCNFAVNFYLYCLTGLNFRQRFLTIVSCRLALGKLDGKSTAAQSKTQSTLANGASSLISMDTGEDDDF